MATFKVKGLEFQTSTMDLFKQVQVLRRIGPFAPQMMMAWKGIEKGVAPIDAAVYVGPDMLQVFTGMKDDDVQYVINSCLDVTQINQAGVWCSVMVAGRMAFQQIDMFTMGSIVWNVLRETFQSFFIDLKSLSPAAEAGAAA